MFIKDKNNSLIAITVKDVKDIKENYEETSSNRKSYMILLAILLIVLILFYYYSSGF